MSTPTPVTTSAAILGQTLIALRKAKGMTQGEVADNLGMSASNWSRAEKGESSLTVDQLRAVARVLETTPEEILKATEAAELEAANKGLRVVVGTVVGGNVTSVTGAMAVGALAGSVIPVVGTVLGTLIGSAIGAYLSSQKPQDKA